MNRNRCKYEIATFRGWAIVAKDEKSICNTKQNVLSNEQTLVFPKKKCAIEWLKACDEKDKLKVVCVRCFIENEYNMELFKNVNI